MIRFGADAVFHSKGTNLSDEVGAHEIAHESHGNHAVIAWSSRGNHIAIAWSSRGNHASITSS